MLKRKKVFFIMMAVVFFSLLIIDKMYLQEKPQPLSQQIAASEAMAFLQAGYDDPAALQADLARLDKQAESSVTAAKIFLHDKILRRSLDRFEAAVMQAPDAPLETLHNYIIANMGAFLPECAEQIKPEIGILTGAMTPPPPAPPAGHKPEIYIYKLMADVIHAAEAAPALKVMTSEKTPDQMAQFYSVSEIMVMKQQGLDELMARISNGTQKPEDQCALLLVEAEALNYVPGHAYSDMLKGAVISGTRLRLKNSAIAP